jgi:DNA-binding NarL/FixJ family response regulator
MLDQRLYGNSRSNPLPNLRMSAGSSGLCSRTRRFRSVQDPRRSCNGEKPRDSKSYKIERTVCPHAEPLASILCVEHEEDTAGPLAERLSDLGYAVDLARDAEVGLAKIVTNRPNLILCNSSVPRIGGLELLQKLSLAAASYAKVPFILLTERPCRDSELAARRLGADDCLPKPIDFEMLSVVVKNRLRHTTGKEPSSEQAHLTEREKVVLTWVGRGKTSSEIAIILSLSERTVNFHCDQAMKRLDVTNRTRAVTKAMAQQLITI